jgi:hypothetical protein
MSFLVSFFNSSSGRNRSANEEEYHPYQEEILDDMEPPLNLETQIVSVVDSDVPEASAPTTGVLNLQIPETQAHKKHPMPLKKTFGSADEIAVLGVPAPSTDGLQSSRMRSLSKVFTSLPIKPLPTFAQMVVDQVEFIMHVLLLETDPLRALEQKQNLLTAVDVFQNHVANGKALMQSGRLYSRMMLASLACDLATMSSIGNEGEDDVQASELPPEGWKTFSDSLIFVKNLLLKRNANAPVDFNGEFLDSSDDIDEQLSIHIMMTVYFDEVIRLLAVHEELARLNEQLENVAAEEQQEENTSLDSSEKSTNKSVERCVNSFMKNLSVIFPPDEASAESDDIDDGIEIEDEMEGNFGRTLSNIPKELHSLALTELYSPKQQPQASSLVERLIADIRSITTGTTISQPGRFSFVNLFCKVRERCKSTGLNYLSRNYSLFNL